MAISIFLSNHLLKYVHLGLSSLSQFSLKVYPPGVNYSNATQPASDLDTTAVYLSVPAFKTMMYLTQTRPGLF